MSNLEILKNNKGAILIYILIFGVIFSILLAGLLGFILLQIKISEQKVSWQESLNIAEAGIEYYKWCINNEVTSNCETEKEYQNEEGKTIGKFQIQLETNSNCGLLINQKIISTGWTYKFPQIKRRVSVFYGKESVAKYSYILNSNVWIGVDHIIRGPYHSNGGIRFDGQNLSTVSSAQEIWECTNTFGCGPEGRGYGLGLCPPEPKCQLIQKRCLCQGVFSTTQNSKEDLFLFPIPQFDFEGITVNLAQVKQASQNLGGIYLPPSKNLNSQGKGYHLIFFKDPITGEAKVEVKIITNLSPTWAYSLEEDWHYDYFTIIQEVAIGTYTISPSCSVIFVEDNLWPEGQIKGKITVVSANLIEANKDTDIVLNQNLDYAGTGNDGLTLIGERNILIGPNSPNYMILKGIFIAQKGRFSRNHYPNNIKESLTIYGSIVSAGRVGTQWINLGGHIISGYKNRETYIDRNLIYNPPGFTPFLSNQFKIIGWDEI